MPTWRNSWDWALFAGGAVPALIFGVAVGNVLLGVPFHLNDMLMPRYDGNFLIKFLGLLRPVRSACRCRILLDAAACTGPPGSASSRKALVANRARRIGTYAGIVAMAGYALAGLWLAVGIDGFASLWARSSPMVRPTRFTPRWRGVAPGSRRLCASGRGSLRLRSWALSAWRLTTAGLTGAGREVSTLLWSKLGITGVISSVGLTMFPFILPSTVDPNSSLTVWDSLILASDALHHAGLHRDLHAADPDAYTAWVYKVLWGKVTEADVTSNSDTVY